MECIEEIPCPELYWEELWILRREINCEKATAVSGCQLSRGEETSSGKLAFPSDRRTILQIFLPFKTTDFPAVLKTFSILASYTSFLFRTIPWILGQFMGLYTTCPTSSHSKEILKSHRVWIFLGPDWWLTEFLPKYETVTRKYTRMFNIKKQSMGVWDGGLLDPHVNCVGTMLTVFVNIILN